MIDLQLHEEHRTCTLDAGRRNVLGPDAVDALAEVLRPDPQRPVLVLRGRSDGFSAGLDTTVLAGPRPGAETLLAAMGRLLADALAGPTRILAVCEGHAVAAGAMLLLVADRRLGVPGDYSIGFTEPRIGMPLPELPVRLARERLDRRRLHEATVLGRTFGPDEAAEVGFLDAVVSAEDLAARVTEEVSALARMTPEAYAGSQQAVHGDLIDRVEALAAAQEERARQVRSA